MKFLLLAIFFATVASIHGLPKPQVAYPEEEDLSDNTQELGPYHNATVISENSETRENGYSFSFETSNQIKREETGTLKEVQNESGTGVEPVIVVQGSYSYVFDGKTVKVNYNADEEGFKPIVLGDTVTGSR